MALGGSGSQPQPCLSYVSNVHGFNGGASAGQEKGRTVGQGRTTLGSEGDSRRSDLPVFQTSVLKLRVLVSRELAMTAIPLSARKPKTHHQPHEAV
jgi:hypothetical protein